MSIVNKAAYEIPNFYIGVLEANQDLSAEATYQYSPVKAVAASGAGVTGPAAVAPADDHAQILGILQNNPALAEAATVMVEGVSKALLGGNVTVGQFLMVSGGKLVAATTGFQQVAMALQAGANGEIASVLLGKFGTAP